MAKAIDKTTTMDKKKVEQFRKKLEERQQDLRRLVTRTAEDGRAADAESAQDIADKAASSYNKEFLFHQSSSERQLLNMVESALERIRQGSFGQCINCGSDINPKRLEAVPWTRYCIACQEKLEKGQLEAERE
jgi:RNA polymerase-binding transcription factor